MAVTHPDPPPMPVSQSRPRPCPPGATAGCLGLTARAPRSPARPPGEQLTRLPALFPLPWSRVLHSEPLCSGGSVRGPLFSLHTQCPSDLCQASTPRLGNRPPAPCASVLRVFLISLPAPPPSEPAAGTAEAADWTSTRSCQAACGHLLGLGHCALPARNPDPSEVTACHPFPPTSGSHSSALSLGLACLLLTQTNVHACPWGPGFLHAV